MKKIFVFVLTIFLSVGISQAMLVHIPKAKILKKRFDETVFKQFVEETDILTLLAGKKLSIMAVHNRVNIALAQYEEYLKQKRSAFLLIKSLYLDIIQLILEDSPAEYEELLKIIGTSEKD